MNPAAVPLSVCDACSLRIGSVEDVSDGLEVGAEVADELVTVSAGVPAAGVTGGTDPGAQVSAWAGPAAPSARAAAAMTVPSAAAVRDVRTGSVVFKMYPPIRVLSGPAPASLTERNRIRVPAMELRRRPDLRSWHFVAWDQSNAVSRPPFLGEPS